MLQLSRHSFAGAVKAILFLEVLAIVMSCQNSEGKDSKINNEFNINLTSKVPTSSFSQLQNIIHNLTRW